MSLPPSRSLSSPSPGRTQPSGQGLSLEPQPLGCARAPVHHGLAGDSPARDASLKRRALCVASRGQGRSGVKMRGTGTFW